MNLEGILIGAITFAIIGVLHPIVIKGEYHYGKKIWPLFLISGIASIILSLFIGSIIPSILLAVLGFSLLWSIHEVIEQEKRVEKGWFPKNPKRKQR